MRLATIRSVVAALLLSAVYAGDLHAQRVPDTRGLHLGAAVNATSIKLDETAFSDDERENGYGADVYIGYNFTRNLGLTFGITAANINDRDTNDFSVAHADIAGRFSFPGRSAFVPYLELSLTGVGTQYEVAGEKVELRGGGIGLGGGFNYFFGRRTAFDAAFRFTTGEFDDGEIDDRDIDVGDGVGFNTTRLKLGLAFYP
jgi:hypothetical protein